MTTALPHLFCLQGKRALITGGGSGIGFVVAQTLTQAGASVTLVGRNEKKLQEAASALQKEGANAAGMVCDLARLEGIAGFYDSMASERGEPDIVVNAAGNNPRRKLAEVTPALWRETLDANLSSAFFVAQAAAPAMLRRGWGRVINIASLQCRLAFADGAPYGAAKGGVAQLTRAMAREWSAGGVNANAIAPGFFPTAMTAAVLENNPQSAQALAKRTAIGRNGELADLRGAALFFASPASDYITGQTLFVDGGFTAT